MLRALIIDSATGQFRRHGYEGATTAAIARGAGVSEAQLFRTFRSKAELFRASILEPLDARLAEFNTARLSGRAGSDDWRRDARAYVADLIAFIEAQRDLFMPLIVAQHFARSSVDGVAAIGSLDAYFRMSAESMAANLAPGSTVDPRIDARVSFAAVLATVLFRDWLFPKGLAPEGAVASALTDFVLDGIGVHHRDAEG